MSVRRQALRRSKELQNVNATDLSMVDLLHEYMMNLVIMAKLGRKTSLLLDSHLSPTSPNLHLSFFLHVPLIGFVKKHNDIFPLAVAPLV